MLVHYLREPISIHALREEGDPRQTRPGGQRRTISIHALREEGDQDAARLGRCLADFYPRPPRGGRHSPSRLMRDEIGISIHALREEGDSWAIRSSSAMLCISIHALREEGDDFPVKESGEINDFYPRPPRGGRQRDGVHITGYSEFLSTPSARRATAKTEKNISAFVLL